MLTLYYAPRTRAVRISWLLEELGLAHELKTVPFRPPDRSEKTFSQPTPLGKFPVLEDGDVSADFSGADIMLGFTVEVARVIGVLDERYPRLAAYLERLKARPAFQKAQS